MTEIKTMVFTSFTVIPEKCITDFELGYVYKLIVELFCVIGREKLSELYQIALNGDISVVTLRALDEEKGQELPNKFLALKSLKICLNKNVMKNVKQCCFIQEMRLISFF